MTGPGEARRKPEGTFRASWEGGFVAVAFRRAFGTRGVKKKEVRWWDKNVLMGCSSWSYIKLFMRKFD